MESALRGRAEGCARPAAKSGLVGVKEDLRELLGVFLSLRNEAEAKAAQTDLQSTKPEAQEKGGPADVAAKPPAGSIGVQDLRDDLQSQASAQGPPQLASSVDAGRTWSHAAPSRRQSGASVSVVSLPAAEEECLHGQGHVASQRAKADLLELWSYIIGHRGKELVSPSSLSSLSSRVGREVVDEVLAHEKVLTWLYSEGCGHLDDNGKGQGLRAGMADPHTHPHQHPHQQQYAVVSVPSHSHSGSFVLV
mmetsp:Transcript_41452/g.88206  ORF Transcript_41452/g.88206 Transcript_41452/m.88206 type:complete len:250 (+) Transcript_41452:221-970(+)